MPSQSSRNVLRAVLLAVAALASAQSQTAPKADVPSAFVSGVVTNSITGAPISCAHVVVYVYPSAGDPRALTNGGGLRGFGVLTNGEGKFSIGPLPPGSYSAVADRVGYVTRRADSFLDLDLNLAAGDHRDNLKFPLTPTGAISGRVLNAKGDPEEGWMVEALGGAGNITATGDDGEFRIGGLDPGTYRLVVTPFGLSLPGEIRSDGVKPVHLARTYYPSSLDAKSAERVKVDAGAEVTGIDIHLVQVPVVTVSGKVSGNTPGSRTIIEALPAEPKSGERTVTLVKPDGSYRISSLDPGKYYLTALVLEGQQGYGLRSAPVEIHVGAADIDHLDFRMMPRFDVTGKVVYESENAVQLPGAATDTPTGSLQITPEESRFMFDVQPPEIAADGTFTILGIAPGRYRLSTTWGPYVKSVRVGSVETEGDILDVRNGPAGVVTLTLSRSMCEISGTVSDSNGPVPSARVAILHDGRGGSLYTVTTADKNGVYHLSVLPGKYKLLAGDDILVHQAQRSMDSDDESGAESIEVHAGDKLTKDLKRQ